MSVTLKSRVFAAVIVAMAGVGVANATHLSDKSVAERTKPVAEVYVEGDNVPSAAPAAAAAPTGPRTGEQIVQAHCGACHLTGAAGAPKIGTADWTPRKAKGIDTLLQHALNGFNAMPPKGLCMDCSDEDIKHTIEYMLSKAP